MTKTPEGDLVAADEWPPRWCVVCDQLPYTPHVRDEGHACELPMRVNPSLSRAKIKRIRERFDAMRAIPAATPNEAKPEPIQPPSAEGSTNPNPQEPSDATK